MTHDIIRNSENGSTGLTIYDRVEPMEFIEKMGKVFALTGAGGCQNANDGQLMALACLCDKKTVFDIARRYHLMTGKLVLKAETMLGDFRRAGGKHRWIKDGADGVEASLELTDKEGNKLVSPFTFAKAQTAGYVKKGSQWEKRPDQMLRSRCITDGIRMLCPEISSGEFVEEEIEDERPTRPAAATTEAKPTVAPTRTAAEVAQRAKELTGTSTAATTPAKTADPIVDAHVEKVAAKPTATTESAPFAVEAEILALDPANATDANQKVLMEIELTVNGLGVTVDKVLESLNKKKGTSYTKLDELPEDMALTLLENMRNIAEQQRAAKAGQSPSPT